MNFKYQDNVPPGMIFKCLVNVVVIIIFFNTYFHFNVLRLYESRNDTRRLVRRNNSTYKKKKNINLAF